MASPSSRLYSRAVDGERENLITQPHRLHVDGELSSDTDDNIKLYVANESILTNARTDQTTNLSKIRRSGSRRQGDDEDDDDITLLRDDQRFTETSGAENNVSNLATIMNLLKANIGTGILALPNAFANAGLVVGVLATLFIGFVCVHCMHALIDASHYFCAKMKCSCLSYPEVVRLSFEHSPLKRYARAAQRTISGFLFVTQIGFCCVYIVFVARSIENLLEVYWHRVPVWQIQLSLLPFLLLLVMIRNLRGLAILSMVANVITFCGLAIIFQESLTHLLPASSLPAVAPVTRWPKFFGTAIFAFEGIGCVLPMENKMRHPQDFGGWCGVLSLTMVIVAVMYCAIGFFGYLGFGNDVAASITYSLPHQPVYQAVKAFMAIAIFFSYGLQFYVPMQQLITRFRGRYASIVAQAYAEYSTRIGLLLLTMILSLLIPHLAEIIALIGAFASSFLAIIVPAILDLVYRYEMPMRSGMSRRYGFCNWIVWKDIGVLIFGLAGFVLGTLVAVQDLVDKFRHPEPDS